MQHNAEQPTVYQWNTNVQRQLTKDFVVSAGYRGIVPASFGQLTRTSTSSRQIQLGLKITW